MAKPKLALYWAASCGGCEIAQLQIGDKILERDGSHFENKLERYAHIPVSISIFT